VTIYPRVAHARGPVYEARHIKRRTLVSVRKRRTQAELAAFEGALVDIVLAEAPMTVRQVYYQAVSRALCDKTEAAYDAVGRALLVARRDGRLPYCTIADSTRWMRKPATYDNLDAALLECARTYRRALWNEQTAYVEVWLEKDALSGVLVPVTDKYDVPLMTVRGYASESFLASAAEVIAAVGKPTYLYYFGDHDPSGVDIPVVVERRLRAMAPGADFHFECVAVTQAQIDRRPTKKSDSRARKFIGESVEVDAIPPADLRGLVEACIKQHLDPEVYGNTLIIEDAERATARLLTDRLKSQRETRGWGVDVYP